MKLRSALLVALLVALLPATSAPLAVAQEASPVAAAPALDLPSLVLTPGELAEPGYGLFFAAWDRGLTADEPGVGFVSQLSGLSIETVATTLTGASWRSSYISALARPRADNVESFDRLVVTHVMQFSSSAGASSAFTQLEAETPQSAGVDRTLSRTLGDESELTSFTRPLQNGSSQQILALSFRTGSVIAAVVVIDTSGAEPAQAELEALAALVEPRVANAVSGAGPVLSLKALRLSGLDYETDSYALIESRSLPAFGAGDEEDAAYFGDAISSYRVTQSIDVASSDPMAALAAPPRYAVELLEFPINETASAWIAAFHAGIASDLTVRNATVLDGVAGYGDESVFSSNETDGGAGTRYATRGVVRIGSLVFRLGLSGSVPVPVAAVEELVALQVDCLTSGDCAETTVPLSFLAAFSVPEPETSDGGFGSTLFPEGTRSYSYEYAKHDETFTAWTESPPVGGWHYAVWQSCGFYSEPVGKGNAVHSLEHGAVWITYRPDLDPAQIERLREIAENDTYILVSPYSEQTSPIVVTAWNHQLALDSVDDERLIEFIRLFKTNPAFTPEYGAPCTNGTSATVPEGS